MPLLAVLVVVGVGGVIGARMLTAGHAKSGQASGALNSTAGAPSERVAYYGQWSVYAKKYYLKEVDTSGAAARLTTLNYAFENIDPDNLTCFEASHKTGGDNDPNAGDYAGDTWADYQMPYTAATSVDGSADAANQALKGNFNQLRELKAKYPQLKVLVSIGGWTFSKYFSDAAATAASRQKFAKSCIDMFVKGMLSGKAGAGQPPAAGIFDGIDIDWEFPASAGGHVGNHSGAQDTQNFTLLMAEFRRQLDEAGKAAGRHYLLTAAVPAQPKDIAKIETRQVDQYLDWANVMAYDMHGSFEAKGPTNFTAPLYTSPKDPSGAGALSVDVTVKAWLGSGMPASKLVLGLPFYWRGWKGVPAGNDNGLYQTATGPSAAYSASAMPGVATYGELAQAGKLTNVHWDDASKSPWIYVDGTFMTGDDPRSLRLKADYAKASGLRGLMLYSLDNDTASAELLKAVTP